MTTFNLPDLGEGLQEAELVAWHVGAGDHVVADQPLLSVETEKAVVEIPSPRSGRIAKLFGEPGDVVKVGSPLVAFEEGEAKDTGTVVGAMPEAAARARGPKPGAGPAKTDGRVKVAPAARALAQSLGVDLAPLEGTGPQGTITAEDVRAAKEKSAEAGNWEPVRGVRRAMAVNMARAHAEVVPATITDQADVESWPKGVDVTIRLVRAMAAGCQASPALNAWYDGRNQARLLHKRIDLGIAVATDEGLFAPVLRNVARRESADLRRGLEALKRDVAQRTVPIDELRGQTITLSNFGLFGGLHAALVVVPPQVAIVGAGTIHAQVVARGGAMVVHRILPLSLTFDHRAATGVEAAHFLAAVKADLEKPE